MTKIDRNEFIRFQKMNSPTIKKSEFSFRTGGKPSTWFPPGGLVEHISDDRKYHTSKLYLKASAAAVAVAEASAAVWRRAALPLRANSVRTSDSISYLNFNLDSISDMNYII